MDFHEFWSFLVFNFEETVLEAQKELSLWIGPPESYLFIFLKKMENLTWNSLIFTFIDLKLRRNRCRGSERIDQTDFIYGNVCLDTFFQKKKIHIRIIQFDPNLDATAASLTQEAFIEFLD